MKDTQGTNIENDTLRKDNVTISGQGNSYLDSIEKYRMLVDNILDNITILSLDGTTIYESPSIEGMLGYKPQELVGRNVFEFIHPDDIEFISMIFAEIVSSEGNTQIAEFRYRHKDGSYRVVQSKGRKHVPANGEPVVIVSTRDITAQRETEEHVKKQDKLYKIILENFPNGTVTLYDREFRYLLTEGQELEKAGVKSSALTGKTIHEFMPSDKAEFIINYLKHSFDGNEYNYEIKNGNKYYKLTTLPIKEKNGEIHTCLAITQNITEMKMAIEELRVATEELIQTRQELIHAEKLSVLGRFTTHIAHEVRNPLANISASGQFLLKKTGGDPKIASYIDVILRNAETANMKIKEMLDFVSPRGIVLKQGKVAEVVEDVIKLTCVRCAEKEISVSMDFKSKLPPVNINVEKLNEAILNFASNAIEAMPDGGKLNFTISHNKTERWVVIEIEDTGTGISKENASKILEPFFTTKITGTGLGMSLAHQIIQGHHGSLHIESEEGEGTKLTITLPVA